MSRRDSIFYPFTKDEMQSQIYVIIDGVIENKGMSHDKEQKVAEEAAADFIKHMLKLTKEGMTFNEANDVAIHAAYMHGRQVLSIYNKGNVTFDEANDVARRASQEYVNIALIRYNKEKGRKKKEKKRTVGGASGIQVAEKRYKKTGSGSKKTGSGSTLGRSKSFRPGMVGSSSSPVKAAASASTPVRNITKMSDRFLEQLGSRLDTIASELEVLKASNGKQARKIRERLVSSADNVKKRLQHIIEDSLHLTTPQFRSATDDMRTGNLTKGTIHIYIAAYAWPDMGGALSTKQFLEDLIKSDNFGAFTAIDRSLEHAAGGNQQLRADPAFGWENFLNMWLADHPRKKSENYTEEEFLKWFHLDHLFKLGMCWRQNAKKRETSYKTIGELSIGIRRYFPIVYKIEWARWRDEIPGTKVEMPRQESVANVIEEHLQRLFLATDRKGGAGGMLNEVDSRNRRLRKWEYIFNQSLDDVDERVKDELDKLKYDQTKNPTPMIFRDIEGENVYIKSWDKIGEHESRKGVKVSRARLFEESQELPKKISTLRF
jgi:hypothetical protein